jgi:hypothetical protein
MNARALINFYYANSASFWKFSSFISSGVGIRNEKITIIIELNKESKTLEQDRCKLKKLYPYDFIYIEESEPYDLI